MRSRPLVATLCAAAAAVASSVAVAAPASAAPVAVTCGDVVTTDAYLDADTACAGVGLTLVGDVTLDLRGHTLDGEGSGAGISVTLGGTQSVLNGRLVGWSTAVDAVVPPDAGDGGAVGDFSFAGLELVGNDTASDLSIDSLLGGNRATFWWSGSRFEDNGLVFGGLWGGGAVVESSTFVRNATVVSLDSTGVSIANSVLEGNDVVADDLTEGGLTITDSVLVDNRVVDVGGHFMGGLELSRNEIRGSETVVGRSSSYVSVVENTIVGNGVAIDLGDGWGQVVGNVFEENRVAFTSEGPVGGWDFYVLVDGNTFVRNGDAVVTTGAGTELRDNVAHHNTGWGIHAPGVTDLGGNRAWANGSYPQCVGVVCAGKPRS
ncbi:right-handed parallel beta-helix repeat-containing protein [Cellulomonas cellasea]|uniref:Right handed beta helix domain-containing protein n=1 Tax=Cellulomonas cellasea DSM 20118 TaxID=1408250 RepID=A0A0A0BBR9_9CELL|nr:right-handed parallel beta-helix repeat-containing protein [Cellulomonas cellasea]KGM03522.1 hypothetical protein Q760_02350 [Cellulomonas cellasea DSM 20118]